MWRTHLVGGIAVLAITLPLRNHLDTVPLLASALLGSLLPDLDAPESRLKHLTLGLPFKPFLIPSEIIHQSLGHRNLLHSLWGIALAAILAGLPLGIWRGVSATAGLTLGYASHLLLDAMTRSGIPLLYPHRRARFHVLPERLRVTTGAIEEDIYFGLFTAVAMFVLFAFLSHMPSSTLL